jgi:tetratricopeptide (TPR) repeat protein
MNALSDKPSQRWMIFAFTFIVFVTTCVASGYAWYADHLSESADPANWLRAAQMEPGNGEYWYKVGFNRQWDLNDSDSGQVLTYLRRAVAIDPRSANYWMALAGAYESAGQLQQARDAFHTALQDYPSSAEAHWRYGSFLLRQGEIKQGYAEIHFGLQIDGRLIPLAISRVWPATHDAEALLNDVLPHSMDAQETALESFTTDNLVDPALVVWKHMVATGESIPIQTAFPMVNNLIAVNRGNDAREVWRQALAASGHPDEANTGSSVVFNGGFEFDAAGGGLDWHLVPTPGVTYDYDSANAHSGKRALRLTFDGDQNYSERLPERDGAAQHKLSFRGIYPYHRSYDRKRCPLYHRVCGHAPAANNAGKFYWRSSVGKAYGGLYHLAGRQLDCSGTVPREERQIQQQPRWNCMGG